MKRNLITLKVNEQEKADIDRLAKMTERNQSDAIRWAVRQVLRQMTGETLLQADNDNQPHYTPAEVTA